MREILQGTMAAGARLRSLFFDDFTTDSLYMTLSISVRTASLQAFVNKKKESIQKYEINSQKCRQRYLPKYRAMLKDRERHCLAEHRIGQMYKRRIERIVEMLNVKCKNPEIVFDAKEALAACQFEIESLPQLEVPESLKGQLK